MIGGRILDPSALAALIHGNLVVGSWLAAAPAIGMTVWVPQLARTEVETIYPRSGPLLVDLAADSPHLLFAAPTPTDAAAAARLLTDTGRFDVTAALVVHTARTRGWPVLSADPGRLTRIDPTVTVETI